MKGYIRMLKRNDLIEKFAQLGYTKSASAIIWEDVKKVLTEALVAGESVQLHGFGTFSVKEYAEREVVDMHTQEKITVPAYKAPKFTAGKLLKRAVKEGLIRE